MKKKRRRLDATEKVRIVLEGLKNEDYIASLCRKERIHYTQFYEWKKLFIEGGKKYILKELFAVEHPDPIRLREGVLQKQKLIIQKLLETNKLLKNYIKINKLDDKYRRYSFEDKKKIVAEVNNSSLSLSQTLKQMNMCRSTYYDWVKMIAENPEGKLPHDKRKLKFELPAYRDMLFSIIHAPPKQYGYNRTTWIMRDLKKVMTDKGFSIGNNYIRRIIKSEGYRFLKARKVLTSTDPEYKQKLENITHILSNLKDNEKFFSIDEYGPFAVKIQGGRSLTPPGQYKTYPQFQKSKGCLILTGALELSSNQFTHFYSGKKNTGEMLRLLDVLLEKYPAEKCLYLSWDAASWHMSKDLYKKVEEINRNKKLPNIKLVPLPACAQFLNVIESVFSGMARAIIHNSNYDSVEECINAIDRHFKDRNTFYKKNPKRAGKKLWGKERVIPVFNESNNCKDPKYLHNF